MEAIDETNMSRAVSILAEAFHDDPVMNWMFKDPPDLVGVFEMMLPTFVPHGLTYVDPQGRGAASWLGPEDELDWNLASNAASALKIGGLGALYRLVRSGMTVEKYHPNETHYYLFAIGALASSRGQGVGTALISHMLRTCDEQGIPAYLENSKQQNLAFYRGHGFEVMQEIRFAKSAPPLWLMWREPQPLTGEADAG